MTHVSFVAQTSAVAYKVVANNLYYLVLFGITKFQSISWFKTKEQFKALCTVFLPIMAVMQLSRFSICLMFICGL